MAFPRKFIPSKYTRYTVYSFCKLIIAAMFWPFLFNFTGSPTVPKDADGLVSH